MAEYTLCYNCNGSNKHMCCGFPMLGCILCKKYGNGFGKLLKEYSDKEVEIEIEAISGQIVKQKFVPPAYKCLTCKDTLKMNQTIWVKSKEDHGCSDNGAHNMPSVELPCSLCRKEEYEIEKNKKTIEFNN